MLIGIEDYLKSVPTIKTIISKNKSSKMCKCQTVRYLFLCGLIGFAVSHPISNENTSKNLRPTSTSTTVKSNLLNTNLLQMEPYTRVKDLNSFVILEPVIQTPFTIVNKRASRSLNAAQFNEPVDVDFDMEFAEVNVFRPLFRYRAEVARNVGQRQFG